AARSFYYDTITGGEKKGPQGGRKSDGQLPVASIPGEGPWQKALLGFAQVDEAGKVDALPDGAGPAEIPESDPFLVGGRVHAAGRCVDIDGGMRLRQSEPELDQIGESTVQRQTGGQPDALPG